MSGTIFSMAFTIRKFNQAERLADKLKALRKEANFTLSEMERRTKVNKTYLRYLEAGTFDKLPDPIYTRNFIKIYLRVLRTESAYYLNLFEQERGTCDFVSQARLPRQRAQAFRFLVASRFVKMSAFTLIALSVMLYLGLQVRSIITPPVLFIDEPLDGFVTTNATILVTGNVKEQAQVRINGKEVLLTDAGLFEVTIALERGLNLIKVESMKRYSRPSVEYRRVILDQTLSQALPASNLVLKDVDN